MFLKKSDAKCSGVLVWMVSVACAEIISAQIIPGALTVFTNLNYLENEVARGSLQIHPHNINGVCLWPLMVRKSKKCCTNHCTLQNMIYPLCFMCVLICFNLPPSSTTHLPHGKHHLSASIHRKLPLHSRVLFFNSAQ